MSAKEAEQKVAATIPGDFKAVILKKLQLVRAEAVKSHEDAEAAKAEVAQLREQNAEQAYRIKILLRSLEELDRKLAAQSKAIEV